MNEIPAAVVKELRDEVKNLLAKNDQLFETIQNQSNRNDALNVENYKLRRERDVLEEALQEALEQKDGLMSALVKKIEVEVAQHAMGDLTMVGDNPVQRKQKCANVDCELEMWHTEDWPHMRRGKGGDVWILPWGNQRRNLFADRSIEDVPWFEGEE